MSAQLTPLSADVRGEAFPVLTAEQINRIRPLSKVRNVKVGEILFEPGDLEIPFFVLLSGSMEIVRPVINGERLIVTHDAGEFTGEITRPCPAASSPRQRKKRDPRMFSSSGRDWKF